MENDYKTIFLEAVRSDENFCEILDILNGCTQGNIWLIGGYVYRNIASALYGASKPIIDIDVIIETGDRDVCFPNNWSKAYNSFGNPKFTRKDGLEIDVVPLNNISSIIRKQLKPTIDNYLTGTPLTVQSIAYDIRNSRIIGSIGLKALAERTIAINDMEAANIYAKYIGKSINEIAQQKAQELGFAFLSP